MTIDQVIKEIRLLQQPTRRKLAINKVTGGNLVWCSACDSGIAYDKKPVHYTEKQKKEVKNMFGQNISHGYCGLCYNIELYKLDQIRSQR